MAEAALAYEERPASRIIKISSKRQVTIPADMYKLAGNPDFALATWNDDGSISIEPVAVRDEAASVKILRSLLNQGLEGDELLAEYERIVNRIVDFNRKIDEGLQDIEEGRVAPYSEMRARIREEYGV